MKIVFTLLTFFIFYYSATSQIITDPSNTPGYDEQKLSTIEIGTNRGLSLTTDSANYQPGSTATINGGGFLAGETVELQVLHSGSLPNLGMNHNPWNATVDPNGNFITSWQVCDSDCLGAHLTVTANGQSSGFSALGRFTDKLLSESCYIEPDETYSEFPNNDDGSIGPIQLPFIFDLYGTPYSQVWINNNGNLTFTGPLGTFSATGFPFTIPMVAGFWSDIDTRTAASGTVKYKLNPTNLIVSWPGVGYFSGQTDKLNTFQIIISNGIDPLIGAGNNVAFYYNDMQWTTGSASGGTDGFGGIPATVGINKGNDSDFVQIGRFNENNGNYNGGAAGNNGVNYLDFKCFPFNVTGIINQQPSVSGLPAGNSIDIICGSSKTISLTFYPPEPYQTVSTIVDDGEICNSIISIVNGVVSNADVTITADACNIGTHVITFSATDNFVIPETNTIEITVNILPLATSVESEISVCNGGILNLTADGGTSYSWTGPNEFTSNEQNPSISNVTEEEEGVYNVVVTSSGECYASASTNVIVVSPPLPFLTLNTPLYDCPDAFSILSVTDTSGENNEPYSYLWSPSGEVTSTISVSQPGTYGVTISNNIGCEATIDSTIFLLPCIVGYYPPPPEGKIEDKIGAELTQLVGHPDTVLNTSNNNIYLTQNGMVLIEVISIVGEYDNLLQLLLLNGMTDIINNGDGSLIITGFFPINSLLSLNAYPEIDYVRPYFPPQSNFNINGATFSLGDRAMLSDSARLVFNVQGDGVKVGIISDSYNKNGGAALNIAQGDLPGIGNIYNPLPVDLLMEYPYGPRSDEGRAMMQIVHDIAPKAELAFRTGFVSPGDFSVGIKQLQQNGCDIIVDDVTYITEPFFQDGVIAKAVDYVKDLGVSYFSAAGNFGSNSYEGVFNPGPTPVPSGYVGAVHNFDGSGDIFQSVSLGLDPGQTIGIYSIVLQWEDDFYSLGQVPGASTDLDIYLVDDNGNRLFGFNRNNIGGDPLEILPFIVRGPTQANIMIVRDSGLTNVKFKYIVFRGNITFNEFRTGVSTLVGQANAAGAMAVGAALYLNTPAFGLDPATIASFSSIGGTSVYGEDRHKPDFVAPNGGNSTVEFGSPNIDAPDPFPNFFGTSSSAPHAAGVAALLLDGRKKFYYDDLIPDTVRSILKKTALDMGTPGQDSSSGSGLIQADKALQTFATAMPVIDSLGFPVPPFIPGTQEFLVTIFGNYLSDSSIVIFNEDTLMSTFLNQNAITAVVPMFFGNPPLQVYTPPTTPSKLDGGFSNSLYFISDGKTTITVTPVFKTKRFGEANPQFSPIVLVDGVPIENTTLTEADLGIDNLEYFTLATNLSDVDIYTVSPINPFDPADPADAVFLSQHFYVFNDGLLEIEKMPLVIIPRDTTLTYGDKIAGIEFYYEYDSTNIVLGDRDAYLNSIEVEHEAGIDTTIGIINGRIVINTPSGARSIDDEDLEDLGFLASARSITNGRIVINLEGGLAATRIIDVSPESLFDFQLDSLNATLVNGSALVSSFGLTTGLASVNGRIVINANSVVNTSSVSSSSNEKAVVIIDSSDVVAPPNDSIALKSLNLITGLYAGTHSLVPGAFMSGNFDISYRSGKLTILPKELTIEADDKVDTCGKKPEFTLLANGLQYDDSINDLFVDPPVYTVFNDQNLQVDDEILPQGVYSIHPYVELLEESNYILQPILNGTLTSKGPLSISFSGDIACAGETACIEILATGGTPPYSGTETFCGYSEGSYSFVVTDTKGCSVTDDATLTDPPAIEVTVTQGLIECNGGTTCITVTAIGGAFPYDGTGVYCDYNAGFYNIEVMDASNCIVSKPIQIIEPSKISVSISVTNAACYPNGTATATASGGTPDYEYLWTPGGQMTQTATGLSDGTYTVKVTDSKGCTSTMSAIVEFTGALMSAPGPITGFANVCKKQNGVQYCIAPVSGASSYEWKLPKGASIVGPANGICISVNFSTKFKGGYICVQAINLCSTSLSTCKNINLLAKEPKTHGSIVGPVTLCPFASGEYMIASVKDATSYNWSTSGGLIITSGQGTASILVTAPNGFIQGSVKVSASNCKGTSGTRVKTIRGLPDTPVWKGTNISVGACGGQTIDYEIEQISGALLYTWSGPLNSLLSDGLGNSGNPLTFTGKNDKGKYSVNVTFPAGFISGDINVFATNSCGAGSGSSLPVISVPEKPGDLTKGHLSVCKSQQNVVYNILNLPGTTSNTWTITGGAVITNNANNNTANVNFMTTISSPVILSVTANNACGSSIVTNFVIDVNFACRGNDDNERISQGGFEVYPNPVNSKVNIRLNGKTVSESDVKIFNLLGESLPAIVTNITTNNGVELDFSGLAKGLYVVRINVEEEYKIFQIIKE